MCTAHTFSWSLRRRLGSRSSSTYPQTRSMGRLEMMRMTCLRPAFWHQRTHTPPVRQQQKCSSIHTRRVSSCQSSLYAATTSTAHISTRRVCLEDLPPYRDKLLTFCRNYSQIQLLTATRTARRSSRRWNPHEKISICWRRCRCFRHDLAQGSDGPDL